MANKDKIETSSFKFQLQRSSTSPLREYERMTANMVWYTFVSKNGTCSVRTIFRSFRFEFCTLVLRPNSMVGNLLFCTTSVDALHTWCCSYAKWWKNVYLFLPIGNETPSCYSGKTIFLPFISHLKYEPYHWNEWAL